MGSFNLKTFCLHINPIEILFVTKKCAFSLNLETHHSVYPPLNFDLDMDANHINSINTYMLFILC